MIDSDKKRFVEILNSASEMYSRQNLSDGAVVLYFRTLKRYTYDEIVDAMGRHVSDPKHGTFYPKVADLIRHIEGGEITTDMVISAARIKETPFGILCRIQIGSFDLESQTDMFYLKQRAQECLDKLPEWKSRALSGEYSDHEISMMLKFEINPSKPFMKGLQSPRNHQHLNKRVKAIYGSEKHKLALEAPHDDEGDLEVHESVIERLKELV